MLLFPATPGRFAKDHSSALRRTRLPCSWKPRRTAGVAHGQSRQVDQQDGVMAADPEAFGPGDGERRWCVEPRILANADAALA